MVQRDGIGPAPGEEDDLEPEEGTLASAKLLSRRPLMVAMGTVMAILGIVLVSVTSEDETSRAQERFEPHTGHVENEDDMAERLRREAEDNRVEAVYREPERPAAQNEPAPTGPSEPTFEDRLRAGRENQRLQRILSSEQAAYDARRAARTASIRVELEEEGQRGGGAMGRAGVSSTSSATAQSLRLHQSGMEYYQAQQARLAAGASAAGMGGGTGELGVAGAPPIDDVTRRQQFFDQGGEQARPGVLLQGVRQPLSPYELKMGTSIPGTLETEINSDNPGLIRGIVAQNVYDSTTGRHLLVPQGSRLVGSYSAAVGTGQVRVQIVWTRINFPNGDTLDLDGMAGADASGASGFRDQVNRHVGRRIGMALLLTAFAVPYEMASQNSGGLGADQSALASGVGNSLVQFGTEALREEMSIPNTLTIRSGFQFNIMVDKDIAFAAPYRGRGEQG